MVVIVGLSTVFSGSKAHIVSTYDPQVNAARTVWEEALEYARLYGYQSLTSWQNEAFLAFKEKLGIGYAYPVNDPDSGYSELKVDSLFGDPSLYIEVPDDVVKQ